MQQHEATPQQLRSFGLLVGGIFGAFGVFPMGWGGAGPRWWACGLAAALIACALLAPRLLQSIYRVWMTVGAILGWINTRIILGVIFYGIFTPIGLLWRVRGTDPMRRRLDAAAETYRVVRQPREPSHMVRQF